MEQASEKKYPLTAKDYELYEEVGEGVSATVYRALCVPLNEIVAIKVLDLEKCNNDLDGIRREVQTMILIDHPNVLRAHCSFTAGHNLWVVMPYMAGGSCLHIMKSAFPEGFEEPVIATLLREVLKALVYLHAHGHIHRDVKAGNILIDSNGAVKLADFGVAACFQRSGCCLLGEGSKKRPSSEKLLKHPFFKHARSVDYLARTILDEFLYNHIAFQDKEADILLQNKALYEDKEQLSQQEYIRGISAWNFNLEDLKNQAALIQDDPVLSPEGSSVSEKHADGHDDDVFPCGQGEELNSIDDLENSLAAFPIKLFRLSMEFSDAYFLIREYSPKITSKEEMR
ncbi:Serine/threonine-protein kinase BLUS1, partial [Sesamum angolense]